jgi:hypothetical protein
MILPFENVLWKKNGGSGCLKRAQCRLMKPDGGAPKAAEGSGSGRIIPAGPSPGLSPSSLLTS